MRIMGEIMGMVIIQKFSHAEAPSMEEASYSTGEMDCSAARNMII